MNRSLPFTLLALVAGGFFLSACSEKYCTDITDKQSCANSTFVCSWNDGTSKCLEKACPQIKERVRCDASALKCAWSPSTSQCSETECGQIAESSRCKTSALSCEWMIDVCSNKIQGPARCQLRASNACSYRLGGQNDCEQVPYGDVCEWNVTTNKCVAKTVPDGARCNGLDQTTCQATPANAICDWRL